MIQFIDLFIGKDIELVTTSFLAALKSLYERVDCAVNINHSLSKWFEVGCGVKQGCILSPTLFAPFVDDLVQTLNDEDKARG